jgi:raffinose/stachyose/melibiose transport system substrate-binding protein
MNRLLSGLAALAMAGAAFAVAGLVSGAAMADVTVKWLHIENTPETVAWMQGVAKAYEAAHPGVTIQMQYLENEAYKAKLPTTLQSPDRPNIIYSWGGGVLRDQVKAGVITDLTDAMKGEWADRFGPAALDAFTIDGHVWGVPVLASQVGFWFNKPLLAKAGVKAEDIKTWDDLLAAVKTIKAAGIVPLATGGADKWPIHFYWTHLAIRLGGKAAFQSAYNQSGDGFDGPVFVKAGEHLKELAALEPFEPGYLGLTNPQASGYFGDGNAAMHLMGNWDYNTSKKNSASGKGLADADLGWFPFPTVAGGTGEPTDVLGGVNGWLVTKGSPPEAVDFLKFLTTQENQAKAAELGLYIPVVKGTAEKLKNPFFRQMAENIAKAGYFQVFYDQMLGANVGRVVNDISADLASGATDPADAASQVQDAWAMH